MNEYFDYGAWRIVPTSPAFERFVAAVIESWRDAGGNPDVALDLPGWLEAAGISVRGIRPLVDVVPPTDFMWQWPARFARSALPRLVASGHLSEHDAARARQELDAREADRGSLMVTPGVLEIIAAKLS